MRIFSNFDTQFRQKILEKKKEQFTQDELVVIMRSRYYLYFRVLFPFLVIIFIALLFYLLLRDYKITSYIVIPVFIVWLLVVWFRVFHKFLKYKYDFTIIDPHGVTTYKQKGILHSFLKEIPGNRIRSIQICRNNILENVFGYGSIDVHTDYSDNMHIGEDKEAPSVIGLTYVDKPYKMKTIITDLCFK